LRFTIARRCPLKRFFHGLSLGVANTVWITSSHVFFMQYIAGHVSEADMTKSMPWPDSPRLMMAPIGLLVGLISGVVTASPR
jgi:hypothetical protein